ncbi:AfsR/SARP family transcriptional regulator, partial [Streptomyces sp. B1866]
MSLGHAKQACVVAVLLVDAGRVVRVEQIVDRVWGDDPPSSVRSVLYGYVARLRATLRPYAGPVDAGGVRLARRSGGYVLEVAPDLVDLHRFRALVAEAGAQRDDARAVGRLRRALGLWRGEALSGLAGEWAEGVRTRLDSERLAAHLALGEAGLRLGRHADLLAELRDLAAAHPLDERVVRQLMAALYGCERQAEALEVYERTRERGAVRVRAAGRGPGGVRAHPRAARRGAGRRPRRPAARPAPAHPPGPRPHRAARRPAARAAVAVRGRAG